MKVKLLRKDNQLYKLKDNRLLQWNRKADKWIFIKDIKNINELNGYKDYFPGGNFNESKSNK
jgi:hypothetical protein